MNVFKFRMKQVLLDCQYCRQALRPDIIGGKAFTCAGGHIYCNDCTSRHEKACISYCCLLDSIIAQIKIKCDYCDLDKYMPYCKFLEHLCEPPPPPMFVKQQQRDCPFARGKCMLKTSSLLCSECEVPLRPPIFRHRSRNLPVCDACYRGDIANYLPCTELDYLVQGITVKCGACKKYLPFSTLALHQVDDCPFKHKLQKIAPGSSARKKFCDEEETERPTTGNSCIHGKNKRKAPLEVGKMDKHIIHGDEAGNDDDSSDDNHDMSEDEFSCEDDCIDKMDEEQEDETPKKPETGKRVAENAFKTPACDKKAKIAMPYGQKTATPTAALAGALLSRCQPITAPRKPPLPPFVPRRPGTRLFQAAHNKNRGQQRTKCEAPNINREPCGKQQDAYREETIDVDPQIRWGQQRRKQHNAYKEQTKNVKLPKSSGGSNAASSTTPADEFN